MVTSRTVLNAIARAIKRSRRLPKGTNYIVGEPDLQGTDSYIELPAIVVGEVATIRDDSHTTDLVGYETDDTGSRIGRIWQASYEMETQIDIYTAAGASAKNSLERLEPGTRRALQRYDSQLRADFLPDENGNDIGAIRELTIGESRPENDLTMSPSLLRQRFSVNVSYVDRLNEVEEFGEIPTIKSVLTPKAGDFVGDISQDYELEYHPPLDTAEAEAAAEDAGFRT